MSKPDTTTIDTQALKSSRLFDVSGRVALVTGGSSGIGRMIATTLVVNGCRVYICSRKEKNLKLVADQLNKLGPGECRYFVSDLESRAGCEALAAHIKANEKRLHTLVNAAGVSRTAHYDDIPEAESWDKVMALNLKAPFYLTAGLTSVLTNGSSQKSPGAVINITSITSLDPRVEMKAVSGEGMGPWSYPISKAGFNHLTSIQAARLIPHSVTVNAILPGYFPTGMTKFVTKYFYDALVSQQPTGRHGQASDVGGLVLFLSSRAATHITGAFIPLDGGSMVAGFSALGVAEKKESKNSPKAKL